MESVIREGTLRLQSTETSCDVILSCQGHRLMAHKLILSIASPILRELLLDDSSEPTVVIFPDINGSIMSLVLDYIYTGNVIVYSNMLQDFLAVGTLLKLRIDLEHLEKHLPSPGSESSKSSLNEEIKSETIRNFSKKEEILEQEKTERLDVVSPSSPEVYSKKNQRKLPNLVPLAAMQTQKIKVQRRLCNYVIPSPWCPRINPVLADPRNDYLPTTITQSSHLPHEKMEENDSNNNFHFPPTQSISQLFPNRIHDSFTSFYPTPNDCLPKSQDLTKPAKSYRYEMRHLPLKKSLFHKQLLIDHPKYSMNPLDLDTTPPTVSAHIKPSVVELEPKTSRNNSTDIPNSTALNKIIPHNDQPEKQRPSTPKSCSSDTIRDLSNNEAEETCDEGKSELKYDRQKPFKCEDCGKSFSQLRNYKYHRSVHQGTKEFAAKCPECGKVFNDRGYLSSHMKIHRDRKEYACPHCPKRFNQRVAYNMHLRIHTGVKPHECPTCGKSFSRKMLLKQHQRVHTGERPYSCPECGKTFADRSNMSLHARLHTGVKPYACNLCPKSFTKKHHLKTHMNFHTGLKPYTCQKCGLAFSQSSNMRTHYKKCILKNATSTNNTAASNSSDNNGNLSS